jgi:DNA-binding transcriptional regulator YiaG
MNGPNADELVKLARLRSLLAGGVARYIRESGGVSQRQAAGACGIPHQTLRAWESGEWIPRKRWDAGIRYLALLDELSGVRRAS